MHTDIGHYAVTGVRDESTVVLADGSTTLSYDPDGGVHVNNVSIDALAKGNQGYCVKYTIANTMLSLFNSKQCKKSKSTAYSFTPASFSLIDSCVPKLNRTHPPSLHPLLDHFKGTKFYKQRESLVLSCLSN
jgi:hypothetical protein